jgi:hypothetical protein
MAMFVDFFSFASPGKHDVVDEESLIICLGAKRC